jgi:hypothetical protein
MQRIPLYVGLAALVMFARPTAGQTPCRPVTVQPNVAVPAGEVSLADLLAPGTCPQLATAAASVRLGRAPLPGSLRVLAADEVRSRLQGLLDQRASADRESLIQIPPRVTVRRAQATMSCGELRERLEAALRSYSSAASEALAAERERDFRALLTNIDCTPTNRLPQHANLVLLRAFWDPASREWEFSMRCAQANDCVPFLVRARADVGRLSAAAFPHPLQPSPTQSAGISLLPAPVVKPGDTLTLLWDQAGIRLVLPVVCLDRGGLGDAVRVRIKNGSRVLRAEVVGGGMLRAIL